VHARPTLDLSEEVFAEAPAKPAGEIAPPFEVPAAAATAEADATGAGAAASEDDEAAEADPTPTE
jgi:hypothetical protein